MYHLIWVPFCLKSSECTAVAKAAYRWELLNLRQYTGLLTGSELNWKNCRKDKTPDVRNSIECHDIYNPSHQILDMLLCGGFSVA